MKDHKPNSILNAQRQLIQKEMLFQMMYKNSNDSTIQTGNSYFLQYKFTTKNIQLNILKKIKNAGI